MTQEQTAVSDAELLQQAIQTGNSFAIDLLVERYYGAVNRLTLSILNDPIMAEDAAQECFVRASLKLGSYRGEASPKTWLFAIAVNICRAQLRRQQRQQRWQQLWQRWQPTAANPVSSPETKALQQERYAQLWTAVDQLHEKHRLPIILRYVHDMSGPEIAAILGISEGTVYSRLHYAHQKLKAHLVREHHETFT